MDSDYKTAVQVSGSMTPPDVRPISLTDKDPALLVLFIAKRPGGVFADRIGVGRTRASDVFLPDTKVSKYHAFFTWDAARALCTLTDAKARNGTFVNSRRIPEGASIALVDGALIDFGSLRFRFHTPDGLFDLLGTASAFAQRARSPSG